MIDKGATGKNEVPAPGVKRGKKQTTWTPLSQRIPVTPMLKKAPYTSTTGGKFPVVPAPLPRYGVGTDQYIKRIIDNGNPLGDIYRYTKFPAQTLKLNLQDAINFKTKYNTGQTVASRFWNDVLRPIANKDSSAGALSKTNLLKHYTETHRKVNY